eukprot:1195484-Prorocentrum_minimum.AAC.3
MAELIGSEANYTSSNVPLPAPLVRLTSQLTAMRAKVEGQMGEMQALLVKDKPERLITRLPHASFAALLASQPRKAKKTSADQPTPPPTGDGDTSVPPNPAAASEDGGDLAAAVADAVAVTNPVAAPPPAKKVTMVDPKEEQGRGLLSGRHSSGRHSSGRHVIARQKSAAECPDVAAAEAAAAAEAVTALEAAEKEQEEGGIPNKQVWRHPPLILLLSGAR